jgi:lysozyme family protein
MEMLRSGSHGDAVLALQKRLMAMGINPGPIDGAFGPKTHDAVERYQEQKGLQVDGIAGPETFASLGMMEGEKAEATEVAESFDRPDRDDHRAQSPVERKAEEPAPAAPSGMDTLREAEKEAEALADQKAESADRAMSEAMKGAAEEAEKAAPKARTGFAAKIAAMREARRARKRG